MRIWHTMGPGASIVATDAGSDHDSTRELESPLRHSRPRDMEDLWRSIRYHHPMPVDVTTWAAIAAAVLGVINLAITTYSTGRRERLKWARETLGDATFAFVDASYRAADGAKKLQFLYSTGADQATIDEGNAQLWVYREELRNSLTKLRVLSTAATVATAQSVRQAISDYCNSLGPNLALEQQAELVRIVGVKREDFIAEARRQMGLRG